MKPAEIDFELPPELKAIGFPSFSEWSKNPGKWKVGIDDLLGEIDRGGDSLKKILQKIYFKFGHHTHKTMFQCLRHMADEGYTVADCDMKPEIIQKSGGKCDVMMVFVPKLPKSPILTP